MLTDISVGTCMILFQVTSLCPISLALLGKQELSAILVAAALCTFETSGNSIVFLTFVCEIEPPKVPRIMSDLLPLVAEALKEKVLYEAKEEIEELRRQIGRVEVFKDVYQANDVLRLTPDSLVHATAYLANGMFDCINPYLWKADFELASSAGCCRLADLRSVRVCVGGSSALACSFGSRNVPPIPVCFQRTDGDSETTKQVSFGLVPHRGISITVVIRGWPRESWQNTEDDTVEGAVDFLVDNVAVQYPAATVEFKDFCQAERTIHGGLERWVPESLLRAARAERDARGDWEEEDTTMEEYAN